MQIQKSQESQRLLKSVKEFFNGSKELNLRRNEVEKGLSEIEQAFIKKFSASLFQSHSIFFLHSLHLRVIIY